MGGGGYWGGVDWGCWWDGVCLGGVGWEWYLCRGLEEGGVGLGIVVMWCFVGVLIWVVRGGRGGGLDWVVMLGGCGVVLWGVVWGVGGGFCGVLGFWRVGGGGGVVVGVLLLGGGVCVGVDLWGVGWGGDCGVGFWGFGVRVVEWWGGVWWWVRGRVGWWL
uniref:Uncharacterized protein n=1 Tax=Knipowitschia caucasica TaxID=637954 RepID=A0AAV2LP43_KNICA